METGGLEFVVVAGVDLNGILRGKQVAADRFAAAPEAPVALSDLMFVTDVRGEVVMRPKHFEGWWPSGATTGHEDMVIVPELTTLRAVPWSESTAIVLGDLRHVDGSSVRASPRAVLQRVLDRAAGLGLSPRMAAELEFFVVDDAEDRPQTTEEGYCAVGSADDDRLLRSLTSHLRSLGIRPLAANREGGPGQYEITIGHNSLPAAAHEGVMLKHAVKALAPIHGRRATFMSKPAGGLFGSGCHLHQSLLSEEDGRNLFHDPGRDDRLSDLARSYIAGQLATLADFTCVSSPTPNSYKRLAPYVGGTPTWAVGNRAVAFRAAGDDAGQLRIENRAPGGEANIYLAMAASLAGGLYGIENGLQPPSPSTGSFYEDPDIERVPMTLPAAIDRFEASEIAREYLGEEFVRIFAGTRRWEVEQERAHVTDWEVQRYADAL